MKCRDMKRSPIGTFITYLWISTVYFAMGGVATAVFAEAGLGSTAYPAAKQITNIKTVEHPNTIDVLIEGNQPLTYTTVRQSSPPALMLYFSDTSIQTSQNFFVPGIPILRSIHTSEFNRNGQIGKIQLLLKDNAPYRIEREESGLKVSFDNSQGIIGDIYDPSRQPAMPEPAVHRSLARSVPSPGRPTPPVDDAEPATVSQIEFVSLEAGKSALVIETTRPVQYDIDEANGRSLTLNLLNSKLPKNHQRPLITDHFESAVDRILPVQSPSQPDTAVFDIELREAVPYHVEQEGGTLRVKFEASSISPKPMVGIPAAKALASEDPPLKMEQDSESRYAVAQPVPVPADKTDAPLPGTPLEQMPSGMATDSDLEKTGPKYTGEKIALDFYDTDIKNVFRILREVSGMNFAIDKDVTGKVTLTLAQPVPWDQVLDLVLKMNKLGKAVEGSIIRIATRETLEEEERIRQEKKTAALALRDQQKQLEPLTTEYLAVNYSNAQREIMPHIEKILTKDRGSVSVDERTNVVILTDTAETIEQARKLIRKLDRVTPQVIIEARVVEATTNFSREIGTTWEMGLGVQEVGEDGVIDVGGTTDTVEDSVNTRVGTGPERGYNDIGGTYGYNMAMNFPLAAENFGSIGFNFVRIAGTPLLLNAKLQAMESQGEGKIISAPKVVTLDNKKAVIKQGISYPYQTVEDGEVNVEFKDVDLLLEVIPHVTSDRRISMNINITKNDLGNVIAGQQSFTTKEAQTELLVNDGDTVVIGGIIKTTERNDMTGIPGLSKVPILGWFFKTEGRSKDKEELLIFITPRIVQLEQRAAQF